MPCTGTERRQRRGLVRHVQPRRRGHGRRGAAGVTLAVALGGGGVGRAEVEHELRRNETYIVMVIRSSYIIF